MVVNDVKELIPIIENSLKSTYGEGIQNIKLLRANQIPIIDDKKESWRAIVKFDNGKTRHEVSIDVRISDGSVKRTEKIVRQPMVESE